MRTEGKTPDQILEAFKSEGLKTSKGDEFTINVIHSIPKVFVYWPDGKAPAACPSADHGLPAPPGDVTKLGEWIIRMERDHLATTAQMTEQLNFSGVKTLRGAAFRRVHLVEIRRKIHGGLLTQYHQIQLGAAPTSASLNGIAPDENGIAPDENGSQPVGDSLLRHYIQVACAVILTGENRKQAIVDNAVGIVDELKKRVREG